MRILCIGDIMGVVGREIIKFRLDELVQKYNADFIIANAENATHGRGITKNVYEELSDYGIDAFTMGNHTWGCKDIIALLQHRNNIIRPANYDGECPGRGSMIIEKNGVKIGIINILGRTYMTPCACPFQTAKTLIEKIRKITPIIIVDFHAEATSEKVAMGWYLDGKATAVFGTHTHVQTADEIVLPKGTGYISDLGMTGPSNSVLGMNKHIVIDRFLNGMPQKFELAGGRGQLCGAVFDIDAENGRCNSIERIFIRE